MFVVTPCAYPPIHGMNMLDAFLATEAIDYAITRELDLKDDKHDIFDGKDSMDTLDYLKRWSVEMPKPREYYYGTSP